MNTKVMTWDEAKINSDKLVNLIDEQLQKEQPKSIADVLKAVYTIDKDCRAIPNPNQHGQCCQLILYPPPKWNTWSQTSMSITKYNL